MSTPMTARSLSVRYSDATPQRRFIMSRIAIIVISLCAALTSVHAQTTEPEEQTTAADKPKPCTSASHRAFDFWLGEWEVTSPPRPKWVASSTITLSNDGCSIHESYATPGGYAGKSVNFFDATKSLWHQTWIDNQGVALYLEGNLSEGTMVLSDAGNRVSWSLLPDKRVRQHWESTADGGKTWTTAFDGYYRRLSKQ